MIIKIDLLTIEIFGFGGQYNQARIEFVKIIKNLDPNIQALFIEYSKAPLDLEGESQEYIKVIYSSRRLANKLKQSLAPIKIFDDCLFGFFPYQNAIVVEEKPPVKPRVPKEKRSSRIRFRTKGK